MASYLQGERLISVLTPLGPDALLLRSLNMIEGLSSLFHFHLELVAEIGQPIAFDKLLGGPICVRLALEHDKVRYFHGICSRIGQGGMDASFTSYHMEVVPQLWLLTRIRQSRIFQQITVPDILRRVFTGLKVDYQIEGAFEPRDYCVQYRESDFDFASRLMEEEGIFYFFRHDEKGHTLVVANSPAAHPDLKRPAIVTRASATEQPREDTITRWEKTQELRSGKIVLWDHSFELPHKHLDTEKLLQENVAVGTMIQKLRVPENDRLEIYEHPGGYAQRFDGVSPSGGDRAADLQKIFQDNKRTVEIRMQEEATAAVRIQGESTCRDLISGHRFQVVGHPDADGPYVLTRVEHTVNLAGDYRSNMGSDLTYMNRFECIPAGLPFRPYRITPRPVVHGTQTAVVVGPPSEEIFTDKYGRVKVQFHWDREGKNDASSSCWIRVASFWAGKNWGAIHIPRIGQEVIVAFQEGDPDQPIIVGSVYNADQMPPYTLPENKTQSGIKSRSTTKGTEANYNEIRFEDKKGEEQLLIHAEKNQDIEVENDETHWVGRDRTKTIDNNETTTVKKNRTESVGANESITISGNRTETVTGNEQVTIEQGNRDVQVKTGNDTHTINTGNRSVVLNMGNDSLTIKMGNQTTVLNLGASSTQAMQSIELKVGANSIKIDQTGVTIKGMMVKVEGTVMTQVKGLMTQVNGDAMLTCKGGITMIN